MLIVGSTFAEVLFIIALMLANGFFAMSEMAIVSSRKSRLQQLVSENERGASEALELARTPDQFLSTIQIWITLVGILAGAFGGATIAEELGDLIKSLHPKLEPYSEGIGVAVIVVSVTYMTLILGELVPKRLALTNPEKIACLVAPLMQGLSGLASPVIKLVSSSTECVLKVLRVGPSTGHVVTEKEIQVLIEEGAQAGVLESTEQELLDGVFALDERRISALMTPLTQIVWLDKSRGPEQIVDLLSREQHSRFPVGEGSIDQLVGIVSARDLLVAWALEGEFVLDKHLQKPLIVPETYTALEVLKAFRDGQMSIALVMDEYGALRGLVTMTDIVRSVMGEITESADTPKWQAVARDDGSWLVDGMIPAGEFRKMFSIPSAAVEEGASYETLAGLIVHELERIPETGEKMEWQGLTLEVVDLDGYRVDKVLVSRIEPDEGEPAGESTA